MNHQQHLGKVLPGLKHPIDQEQINLWNRYLVINPFDNQYDYLNDIIIDLHNYIKDNFNDNQFKKLQLSIDEINLCGGRKAGKTFNVCLILFCKLIAFAIANDLKIACYGFRKLGADLTEFKEEINNALDNIGLIQRDNINSKGHYLFTNGQNKPTWKFVGGSYIKLKGLYKSGSAKIAVKGLASAPDYDLAIYVCEEANEINNSEFEAIDAAVRGAKNTLSIKMSNPDSIFQDYISYCAKRLPFNEKILEQKGQMSGLIVEANIRKYFHYTNYRINPYLTEKDINKLEELRLLNPIKYKTWGIGIPGNIEGSIFGYYLDQLTNDPLNHFIPKEIWCGMDLGITDTKSGHPTCAILVGINEFGVIKPLNEYEHNNSKSIIRKSPTDIATDLVHFCINQASKYPIIVRDNLIVKIDNGGGTAIYMIDILKTIKDKIAKELNINLDWLHFVGVKKTLYNLKLRIDAVQTLISLDMIKIDPNLTPKLYESFSLMVWKEQSLNADNDKLEPLNKFDDPYDAFCYAIMDKLSSINNSIDKYLDKTKIG